MQCLELERGELEFESASASEAAISFRMGAACSRRHINLLI